MPEMIHLWEFITSFTVWLCKAWNSIADVASVSAIRSYIGI